jgi:acyl-CoA thioesterase YciA
MTATTLPAGQVPVLSVVPMPSDSNQHGDIFGGWIIAARRARGRVATVAVNSFTFKQPVMIGDVVLFYAQVARVGRTSIEVDVEVYAQRNPAVLDTVKVTEATLTYVATDPERKPRPVPSE